MADEISSAILFFNIPNKNVDFWGFYQENVYVLEYFSKFDKYFSKLIKFALPFYKNVVK